MELFVTLQGIRASPAAFLGWLSASWWGLENIYPCKGLQWMLLLIAAAQQAALRRIMPPAGSTTGKCQSRDFGIYNLRKAKHLASVSLLSLTQHIVESSCPQSGTSSGVIQTMQRAGHGCVGRFGSTGGAALRHVILKISSISCVCWLVPCLLQQMRKYPQRASPHRPSSVVKLSLFVSH